MQDLLYSKDDPTQKHVLDHPDYSAPTGQREIIQIIQTRKLSSLNNLDRELGTDDAYARCETLASNVCHVCFASKYVVVFLPIPVLLLFVWSVSYNPLYPRASLLLRTTTWMFLSRIIHGVGKRLRFLRPCPSFPRSLVCVCLPRHTPRCWNPSMPKSTRTCCRREGRSCRQTCASCSRNWTPGSRTQT